MTRPVEVAPIDPLAACPGGIYRDELVEVRLGELPHDFTAVRTADFDLGLADGRVSLAHRVAPERIDDDIAGLLRDQLFAPGWLRGGELFERAFTGVVLTSVPEPLAAWELFYRNTLARLSEPHLGSSSGTHGTIADYAPVHAHAADLVVGTAALELGSCFGFLSLRLARAGVRTTASDVSAGTMRLLETVAPQLGLRVGVVVADAARVDAPDGFADTVLAVHLLEHLPPEHGDRVLHEAVRLAAHRVVLAVPLEESADETWGHVRTVSLDDLHRWGEQTALPYDVHECHGGWLVIDAAADLRRK